MSSTSRARPEGRSVREVMITRPHLHPVTLTVAAARTALQDTHVHLLLLVEDAVLRGTVTRDDLAGDLRDDDPALGVSRLEGRAVTVHAPLAQVEEDMAARGVRRQAVVDADGHLVGLLCRKRSGTGFCDDDGVAARAADRDT
ncbi:MAG: hypothetical protein JWR42_2189 [Marmoricola sp.]|nr:hypothetical protein [Marmoricola sp.]